MVSAWVSPERGCAEATGCRAGRAPLCAVEWVRRALPAQGTEGHMPGGVGALGGAREGWGWDGRSTRVG